MRRTTVLGLIAIVGVSATTHAGTVSAIGQFTGDISESWQGFLTYMFNPDFHEASPARSSAARRRSPTRSW